MNLNKPIPSVMEEVVVEERPSTIEIEKIKTGLLECFEKRYPSCILVGVSFGPSYFIISTGTGVPTEDLTFSSFEVRFILRNDENHKSLSFAITRTEYDDARRDLKLLVENCIDRYLDNYVSIIAGVRCQRIDTINTSWVEALCTTVNSLKPAFRSVWNITGATLLLRDNHKEWPHCGSSVENSIIMRAGNLTALLKEREEEREKNEFYFDKDKNTLIRSLQKGLQREQNLIYERAMSYFDIVAQFSCEDLLRYRNCARRVLLLEDTELLSLYHSRIPGYTKRERITYYLYHGSNASFRYLLHTFYREALDLRVILFNRLSQPDLAHRMLEEFILDDLLS